MSDTSDKFDYFAELQQINNLKSSKSGILHLKPGASEEDIPTQCPHCVEQGRVICSKDKNSEGFYLVPGNEEYSIHMRWQDLANFAAMILGHNNTRLVRPDLYREYPWLCNK